MLKSPKDACINCFTQHERGWVTEGLEIRDTPYTVNDFTSSGYLVVEFNREPIGDIEFAWIGDANNWVWVVTPFTPQDNMLVIDLSKIGERNNYNQSTMLKIFLCCYDDSWDDLLVVDAFFADRR